MKKTLLLILLLSAAYYGNAQRSHDVLYLKNGSIIHGTLLELEPEGNVRIRTADGSVFVYPTQEVERLTKETDERARPENGVRQHDTMAANDLSTTPTRNPYFRRGYVGTSMGASLPVGKFADNDNHLTAADGGFQLNLINFGYLFTKQVGVQASIIVGANSYESNDDMLYSYYYYNGSDRFFHTFDETSWWSYGGLLAGPLFSWQLARRFHFDVRPSVGIMAVSAPYSINNEGFYSYDPDGHAFFAMSVGSSIRFDVARPIALSLNVDYLNIPNRSNRLPYNIQTVSFTFGVAYKFKK